MTRVSLAAALSALVFTFGCSSLETNDDAIETTTLPIIGGVLDSGDPHVVMTQTWDGQCTGTLVAPTVVLTAAHCIKGAIDANQRGGRVYFGPGGGEWTATRNISDLFAHRYYQAGLSSGFDIGLIRLSSPAPPEITPALMNPFALDQSYVGAQIRTVGFGADYSSPDGQQQSGFGVKRQVQHAILGVTQERISSGDNSRNTCQGDSGGPTFLRIDGVEYVIAVTSFGPTGCVGESDQTRVDVYLDEFINEVVAAWSGPCQHGDGQCVTDGCGDFPDPDCGECGVDRYCSTGCVKKDLDCPESGHLGDLCVSREQCESLNCIPSDDDERVSYCTELCDPANPDNCGGMECTTRAEGDVCTYPGLTPSVQGAPCMDGTDCRSGVCDPIYSICIEQCGAGFPACAEGFSCIDLGGGDSACTLPRDDGCSAGGTGAGTLVLLLLAGSVILFRKRRSSLFKTA